MRINRFAFLLVLLVAAVNVFAGNAEEKKKGKTKPVYGFGYSFSITDSTVYFTEILELPEAKLQKKTKFLENRQMYSDQLSVMRIPAHTNFASSLRSFMGANSSSLLYFARATR